MELERIGGSSCSYGRIHEALSRGLPASKKVDEESIAFGVKTGSLAGAAVTVAEYNQLQALAKGGILDFNTLAQNTSLVVFHKVFCGLAAQNSPGTDGDGPQFRMVSAGDCSRCLRHDGRGGCIGELVVDHFKCEAPYGHFAC